jgi:histidyl-tRNA synthetase
MKYANKIGAKNTMIIGADELAAGKANIKNMDTGNETEVVLNKLVEFFS